MLFFYTEDRFRVAVLAGAQDQAALAAVRFALINELSTKWRASSARSFRGSARFGNLLREVGITEVEVAPSLAEVLARCSLVPSRPPPLRRM